MSKYTEKLFRTRYGYMELSGDEIRLPIASYSELSEAEKVAYRTREYLQTHHPHLSTEQTNDIIDQVVHEMTERNIGGTDTQVCDHDWPICRIKHSGILFWKTTTVEQYCTKCGAHRLTQI